jgi:hypothetical protein
MKWDHWDNWSTSKVEGGAATFGEKIVQWWKGQWNGGLE